MRILFLLDPIEKLDLFMDNSLALAREMTRRGHQVWDADVCHLSATQKGPLAYARQLQSDKNDWSASGRHRHHIESFDMVLIRKEPPVDQAYLTMTALLETVAHHVPILNDPTGIRNNNEKLITLNFPNWIPETLVSSCTKEIFDFQKKLGEPIVVKPLDEKGGTGIFAIEQRSLQSLAQLEKLTQRGARPVIAQEFIESHYHELEKRIILLNGKILTTYGKKPPEDDFRANLSLGGTYHPEEINEKEAQLVEEISPYLLAQGLHLAAIDVLHEKLIEINVTCPAGMCEAKVLYPQLRLVETWADFLESFRETSWKSSISGHPRAHSPLKEDTSPSPL